MQTNKCKKCDQILGKYEEYASCEGDCKSKYHFACSVDEKTYRKLQSHSSKIWQCTDCVQPNTNQVITRQKSKDTKSDMNDIGGDQNKDITEVKKILNQMSIKLEDLQTIKKDLEEMKLSRDFISKQYDDFKIKMDENNGLIANLISTINDLKDENIQKDKKISILNLRITRLEQQNNKTNLEICNLVEDNTKNCAEQVKEIASEAGVELETKDILEAYRMPKKENSKVQNRAIVVNFQKKEHRDALVKKRKINKVEGNQETTIYFNEQMTPYYKNLFYLTKQRARDVKYKYTWFKNSKILARKEEKSPIIMIETEEDLSKMK